MAAFHSPGENHATEFARGHSWERPLEENPNVAALPGARPFECCRHIHFPADLKKGERIVFPGFLVEVSCQKPARFVMQQWVNANGLAAQKMIFDHGISQLQEFPSLLIYFPTILRSAAVNRFPVLNGYRGISRLPVFTFPAPSVDIFSPTEESA